jgi:hypothetical protein
MAKLFNRGNPIIRYLVATHLAKSTSGYNMERLRKEMGEEKATAYWFERLSEREELGAIHGSKDKCFENAMGKLISFGLGKGDEQLDNAVRVFLEWVNRRGEGSPGDRLIEPIPLSSLAWGGYWEEKAVGDFWNERVDYLYEFTQHKDYSIYADKSEFKGIPKAFHDKLLIDPALCRDGRLRLPWIYDIQAFTALRDESARPDLTQKIDTIVDYVLDPRYQEFPKGYGIVAAEPRHYYALGWSVWLPGYRDLEMDSFEAACFVQRLEMMSHFPNARSSDWFTGCLAHLEGYKTKDGIYSFPREYLKETKNSYFITGGHMGLGEDRRKSTWREIESTYWMLAIKRHT